MYSRERMWEKMQERTKLYNRAMKLRRERGWGRHRIAKELGINLNTVGGWIHQGQTPSRLAFRQPKLNPSPELAYVIGVFYGDGYLTSGTYGKHIKLSVNDRDFAEEFSRCISKVLNKNNGYPIRIEKKKRYCVDINNVGLYAFLRKSLGTHKLTIEKFPADFLRGFFDSEGGVYSHHSHRHMKIYAHNTNKTLMQYIQDILLRHFSIRALIRVHKKRGTVAIFSNKKSIRTKDCYAIRIHRKENIATFFKKIGFSIQRKEQRLMEVVKGCV